MVPVLRLHDIKKTYGDREVLNIEDLSISKGGITGILGPNGSGKTTLLRIMGLLIPSDTGRVEVLGKKVKWDKNLILKLRRQISIVTQTSYMFEGTVYYNVAYGLKVRSTRESKIRSTVMECLNMVGMQDFVNRDARTLSGGERQKVAIARALAIKPKILFLDEPTSNIDPTSGLEIEKYVRHINQEYKTTIVLVTHNLFQAKRLTDEITFLWEGKLVERGATKDIFNNPQDNRTKAFLSGEIY